MALFKFGITKETNISSKKIAQDVLSELIDRAITEVESRSQKRPCSSVDAETGGPSKKKTKKAPSFQVSWQEKRPWLIFDKNKNEMFCTYCVEFEAGRDKTSFSTGCSTFRKTTIDSHEVSATHLKAYQAYVAARAQKHSTPIEKGLMKMTKDEEEQIERLFVTAFHVASRELSFTEFVHLNNLQSRNFNYKFPHYQSDKQCRIFIHYIAQAYRQQLQTMLHGDSFFATINDSSTDTGVTEVELVYVRCLDPQTFQPVTRFLAAKNVPVANAEGIKAVVVESLEKDANLQTDDWKSKLVNCTTDGASVMLGTLNGMVAKLTREVPHLIGIHCTAHRLELAIRDSTEQIHFVETVQSVLNEIYKFYHYSPLKWENLQETSRALACKVLKPGNVLGTRWVAHLVNALEALNTNWLPIVTHLDQMKTSGKGDAKSKAIWLLKHLTGLQFLVFTHVLLSILNKIMSVSLAMQDNHATIDTVSMKLEATTLHLQSLDIKNMCASFVEKEVKEGKYKGVQLTFGGGRGAVHGPEAVTNVAVKDAQKMVSEVVSALQKRFKSFKENPVLAAFGVLFDPRHWPENKEDYPSYGQQELETLCNHYENVLQVQGFDSMKIPPEFLEVMLHIRMLSKGNTKNISMKIWPRILQGDSVETNHRFSNILALVKIALVMAVSSAEAERGFSMMGRVKTDTRARMAVTTLSDLMMTKLGGDNITSFQSGPAMKLWRQDTKSSRLLRNPYGVRDQSASVAATTCSITESDSNEEAE